MNLTYREQKLLLRETEAWHRAERRKRLLALAVIAVGLAVLLLTGADNCSHGRC